MQCLYFWTDDTRTQKTEARYYQSLLKASFVPSPTLSQKPNAVQMTTTKLNNQKIVNKKRKGEWLRMSGWQTLCICENKMGWTRACLERVHSLVRRCRYGRGGNWWRLPVLYSSPTTTGNTFCLHFRRAYLSSKICQSAAPHDRSNSPWSKKEKKKKSDMNAWGVRGSAITSL